MLDAVMPEIASVEEQGPSEFELLGLPKPLITGLSRQGINSPFPIQSATIPDVLAGNDVLGRGQTGSGKTLAFGLPTMARISGRRPTPGRPRAVILVPTRELALQVHDALEPLGRGLSLRMKVVVGGMSMGKQVEALRRGVDIVIATPGRLGDLIRQGECSLEEVDVTVIDEADHMCDLGFFPVVSELLAMTPADGQRLLFSATLDGDVDKLVRRFMKDPIHHSIAPATSPVDTMEHHVLQVTRDDKFDITAEIANREGRTIIFVRTQHGVDRLCKQLARVGVKSGGLHGGKRQNQRTRILAEFKEGQVDVLVCTDVAARGIHVDNISLVLHVDPPQDHKSYLHRGGRTARAGEKGTVVTLVLPNERRSTESLTKRAGIHPFRLKATPGHPRLAEIAGARQPSGESIPVWEPDVRKPLRPRREGSHGGGGGDRRGRRGPRREFDGERRPRRHDGAAPAASGETRTFGEGRQGGYRGGPSTGGGGYRGGNEGGYRSERPATSGGYRSERPAPSSGYRSDDRGRPFSADSGARSGYRTNDDSPRGGGFRSDDRGDRGRPFSADRGAYRADDRPRDGYRAGAPRTEDRPRDGYRAGAPRTEERSGGYRSGNTGGGGGYRADRGTTGGRRYGR
ncbi:DEAD/DEAH box helicase [Nonomuraea sp. NPDC050556]|uniref:DEAD/DEAH box helicase n=1 Tax=Nonomuraea sp. NPDC050556 TaxID=3364369 RepID=UPI0037B8CE9B